MAPDGFDDDLRDEVYFEGKQETRRGFDASLLREPLTVLPTHKPIVLAADATVTLAMRTMQREHRGCVLVTEDGTAATPLMGIFTERDVLIRIIDRGQNPANLRLDDVMTSDPEALLNTSTVAWALNKMSVGGFRHIPVVNRDGVPTGVVSVRDVVQFLVDAFPREVLNLPTSFGEPKPRTREGA